MLEASFPKRIFVSVLSLRGRHLASSAGSVGSTLHSEAGEAWQAASYRGVSYNKRRQKFVASLTVNLHRNHLGYFNSARQAADMYDCKLRELCGKEQWRLRKFLNFPSSDEAKYEEPAIQNRSRGLEIWGANNQKESAAFEFLEAAFAISPQAEQYRIRRLSGASRADALFVAKDSDTVGLPIQMKSSSPRGCMQRFTFNGTSGYAGMLMIFVDLDCGRLWAAAGKRIASTSFSITVGRDRDRHLRVVDLGSLLLSCFHNSDEFPHLSVLEASMQCARSHRVEAAAHLELCRLFQSCNMYLVHPRQNQSTVDSVLKAGDEVAHHLRIQEKASNMPSRGTYRVRMSKYGGLLGPLPYAQEDFDMLAACVLDANELQGMFLIPTAQLAAQGFVGERPVDLPLYPPWIVQRYPRTKTKYGWQEAFFLDVRSWQSSGELAPELVERLKALLSCASACHQGQQFVRN